MPFLYFFIEDTRFINKSIILATYAVSALCMAVHLA
jgi:hypothetical protein